MILATQLPDRWPWLRFALDVNGRFNELHGGFLAGAVTLAAFLSLFPLVLVAIAILGFVAGDRPDLSHDLITSIGIPAQGDAADAVRNAVSTAQTSRAAASIVGLTGLLWSSLGLVSALQYAYDAVWQVTGRGIKDKALGLLWMAGAALLLAGSFAFTVAVQFLPGPLAVLNVAIALALSVCLFLWAGKVLANVAVGWVALLPGALVTAAGFEVLKLVGGVYVPRVVASSDAVYGSIGVVFAILAWLFVFGRLLVYAQVVNVVHWERSHGAVCLEIEAPNVPDPHRAAR